MRKPQRKQKRFQMDDNANVVEDSPISDHEQMPKEKTIHDQKHDLQQSCEDFQTWLAAANKTLEEENMNHLKEFSAHEIERRQQNLQATREDIYKNQQSELKRISLIYQHMFSKWPKHVTHLSQDLRQARKSFGSLLVDMAGQLELADALLPLAKDWEESREAITEFLSQISERSHVFLKFGRNDDTAIQYEAEAKRILSDFKDKLPIRDVYVTSSESIVDLSPIAHWSSLEDESASLCRLWDDLVALFKQFLLRVAEIKEEKEFSQQKEADRIDRQLRKEAKQCCCSKPFKIVKLAEGKYTFGDSRIARLVRIHGSSVVVRVGGGWQFLMEFLMRNDPCRANILTEANLDAVDALGLIPNGPSTTSFSLEISRSRRLSANEKAKIHCRRSFGNARFSPRRNSCGEVSLSGSCDSSLSSKDDYSPDVSSPRENNGTDLLTPHRHLTRHHSEIAPSDEFCCRSLDSSASKRDCSATKTPVRRVSLVDRQNEYAAKRRSLSNSFKGMDVK